MDKIAWKTEKRRIQDLISSEYNPRQASEKETADLGKSLSKFNLAAPLIINTNNHIIGGHFRLHLLKEKGITEIDVRVPDRLLTEGEEKELNLRLNKNLGAWDFDLLGNFDEQMLKDVGFIDFDLGLAIAKGEGRLLYYHKEVECPFCHKQFKKPAIEDVIRPAQNEKVT